jgi:predicted Rossmann-fold nucleotide-binding protein
MPIVLYGSEYWNEVIRFDALVRWGTVAEEDLGLFRVVDSPGEAFAYLEEELTRLYLGPENGS